jgi:hypothetical protein
VIERSNRRKPLRLSISGANRERTTKEEGSLRIEERKERHKRNTCRGDIEKRRNGERIREENREEPSWSLEGEKLLPSSPNRKIYGQRTYEKFNHRN